MTDDTPGARAVSVHEGGIEAVRRVLNRRGRRMTPQRAAIVSTLRRSRNHPTAEEIHESAQQHLPRISLGTVYRNLQVLVEEGYALLLPSFRGHHRYDGDTSDHHHVICRSCGRVADVFLEPDREMLRHAEAQSGYRLLAQRMEFEGRCMSCDAGEG